MNAGEAQSIKMRSAVLKERHQDLILDLSFLEKKGISEQKIHYSSDIVLSAFARI